MGIGVNAAVIAFGCLIGSQIKSFSSDKHNHTLGIGIMVISLIGFLENMYNVQGERIISHDLIVILLAYMFGSFIGEALHLHSRLSYIGNTKSSAFNAFIDTSLLFGVGGLQISGPIALALNNDNSQLLIKSLIDMPLAVIAGTTYGTVAALSALPVALLQFLIALIAHFFADAFSDGLTMQLCSLGYLILFFSGYNLIADHKRKIDNISMLPSMLLIVVYNLLKDILERIL